MKTASRSADSPKARVVLLACGLVKPTSLSDRNEAPVIVQPDSLVSEFAEAASMAQIAGWPCPIRHDVLAAPHRQPSLPPGFAAVYAFSLSEESGMRSPAGIHRVLKVGKVGANSDARFRSQHYGFSAGSTLAKSLMTHQVLWPWLGIDQLDRNTAKAWMLMNLDRDHFFMPDGRGDVLAAFEVYLRARVGSVFEGAA